MAQKLCSQAARADIFHDTRLQSDFVKPREISLCCNLASCRAFDEIKNEPRLSSFGNSNGIFGRKNFSTFARYISVQWRNGFILAFWCDVLNHYKAKFLIISNRNR